VTGYLTYYLFFVIAVSVLLSLIILISKKFSLRWLIVLGGILTLPLIVGYIYATYFTTIPEVDVPDLTGLELEEAIVKLESIKLKGKYAGSVFDMKFAEGKVVSHLPEQGRTVKVGRTVNLITSSGKQKVIVPNLLGRPAIQARAVLAAKGLRLGRMREEVVPEIDPGIILTQLPLPGEEVNMGTWVTLTVSESPEVTTEEGGFKLW
jgi:serine/threonine-protein kinase